ncbi:transcriptional regulator, Crp/Fnr family [Gottschalkia acidurici 9a]|uniref:Transcriptional regulator, Crp/Fnr family n=1 Tax=Gottschalkia acidurici (strain ATCC 7906 / DSM 604 / BCRC 14475 / CIP 104303 / KCTC 5404 / NCIMB 10678 / 9a) TaxID=1128398 RepID=K0B1A4_GOTA9|nr:Crp/Fnr family transcriptional regulator [Gottschalkia acidurici]AFS78852.1 transcriptional regulator, Crp/Fnr family [Gottschalkia acidurici 9a]
MIKDSLRKVPLFKNLSNDVLKDIASVAKERIYKKGNIIISEGNKSNDIYIIKEGKVKVYKTSSTGKNVILDIKGSGSVLAGTTLFSDSLNPATIMTIEDSLVYTLKNSDLENLIRNNSDLALDFIKILSNELHNSQEKITNIALNDTYVRVAKLLLTLSSKHGIDSNDDNTLKLDLNLTREELASLIGTSRETISRALSQFSKENIIDIKGREIIICNKNKLEEWLK